MQHIQKRQKGKEREIKREGGRGTDEYAEIDTKSDLEENVKRNDDGDDGDDSGYKEHLLLLGTHIHK